MTNLLIRIRTVVTAAPTIIAVIGVIVSTLIRELEPFADVPAVATALGWLAQVAVFVAVVANIVRRVTPVVEQARGLLPHPPVAGPTTEREREILKMVKRKNRTGPHGALAVVLVLVLAAASVVVSVAAEVADVEVSVAGVELIDGTAEVEAGVWNCSKGTAGNYGWAYCANRTRGYPQQYRAKTIFEKWTWSCYCWKFSTTYGPWRYPGTTSYAWAPGSGWSAVDTYIQYR